MKITFAIFNGLVAVALLVLALAVLFGMTEPPPREFVSFLALFLAADYSIENVKRYYD